MAINTGKVVAGGLAAGVVLNAIDFVINGFIMKDRMKAEMDAVSPALAMGMEGTNAITAFIVSDFVIGILLVWLYAAIRPRFGPGAGTAVKAGLLAWILIGFGWSSWAIAGVMTWTTFAMLAALALANVLIAVNVGAMIYTEEYPQHRETQL